MTEDRYGQVLEEICEARAGTDGLADAVARLQARLDHYTWVGFYRLEGDELVLGPWRGPAPTEHVRIPLGEGICGAAAASGETELVDDVAADGRYLACFPSTRSVSSRFVSTAPLSESSRSTPIAPPPSGRPTGRCSSESRR